MTSYQYSYAFNNLTGIRSDTIDQTQTNVQNARFGQYVVTNNYTENNSKGQVDFANQQPGFIMRNYGPAPFVIDDESAVLFANQEKERAVEKLQLFQRPFLTVPYLGRGAGDPTVESQLLQGEQMDQRKSVNTIMDKPFVDYSHYPLQDDIKSYINNPANQVEELAMNGWTRGGSSARENGQTLSRPNTQM
jgi:hypothetical protein